MVDRALVPVHSLFFDRGVLGAARVARDDNYFTDHNFSRRGPVAQVAVVLALDPSGFEFVAGERSLAHTRLYRVPDHLRVVTGRFSLLSLLLTVFLPFLVFSDDYFRKLRSPR